MNGATCRDGEVLAVIRTYLEQQKRMPTRKEIMYAISIGAGQLSRNLDRLAQRGKLRKLPVGSLDYQVIP